MEHSKQSYGPIRQNGRPVRKSQKHDANLQKNSTLYFQVGLIVCLLAVFGLLEMRFETTAQSYSEAIPLPDENFEITVEKFKIYQEPKTEVAPKTEEKKVLLTDEPKVVDNDHIMKEALKIETPEQMTSDVPIDEASLDIELEEEPVVEFINVEEVPVYPGCEHKKTNLDKKKCMSKKITKLVQRKFNGDRIASQYGLSGTQRIDVEFQISKTGKVIDIKTRAPHPELEQEAKRVIEKIPEMKPGKQRDKPVGVRYALPIIFRAE